MEKVVSPVVLQGIQARQALITHQQHILQALRVELEQFIGDALAIDLKHENWRLDPTRGVMERVDEPTEPAEIGVQPSEAASAGHARLKAVGGRATRGSRQAR